MEQNITFNRNLVDNLCAAMLCGLLTAIIVFHWTAGFWWGFMAYSATGSLYFLLYSVLTVLDDERALKKQSAFLSK